MTIPGDVRAWINSRAAEAANTPDSLGVTEAERQTARRVQDWLDAQPDAPEPDWTTAPEDATHHAYLHDGRGAWLLLNPGDGYDSPGMWGARMMRFSGLRLPLGIDWRTTLRERPEA